jgi:PKD repeat protein
LAHFSVRRISLVIAIALLALALVAVPGARPAPPKDIPTDFSWTPASPTPGQVVTFTATTNPPSGVDVKNYDWDLNGDGAVDAHGATATWSYPAPGAVSVHLLVKGKGNHRGEAAHTVTVQAPAGGGGGTPPPKPPVASFTISPAAPAVNQPVLFTSSSSDPDGTLKEQVWDLNGDGSYDNGSGPTALRTFTAAGEYVVGLRVTDDAGLVAFYSRTLTVQSAPGAPITTQKSTPRLLNPFPVIRIAGRITPRGTRVRVLRVDTPAGTKVSIRCTGRSCPFRKQVRSVSPTVQSRSAITVRVRRLERLLLPGVQVRLYVTKQGAVGKYTRLRFRAGKPPKRADRCLMPGSWAPAECTGF